MNAAPEDSVLGSYVLAEHLRKRRRRAILDEPRPSTSS
jgi:hypothetical protein